MSLLLACNAIQMVKIGVMIEVKYKVRASVVDHFRHGKLLCQSDHQFCY